MNIFDKPAEDYQKIITCLNEFETNASLKKKDETWVEIRKMLENWYEYENIQELCEHNELLYNTFKTLEKMNENALSSFTENCAHLCIIFKNKNFVKKQNEDFDENIPDDILENDNAFLRFIGVNKLCQEISKEMNNEKQ